VFQWVASASRRSFANAILFIASDEASFITGHISMSTVVTPPTDRALHTK